ncbi:MAG: hypothetical protein LBU60_01140 [Clostridiales bacterium]|jgi:primase-polymerase (primpol)-like protein|nr:hypothetical protein [Clostridiales bacterium]
MCLSKVRFEVNTFFCKLNIDLKKILLNPLNSKRANLADGSTWNGFDKAVNSAKNYGGDGIAVVLTGEVWCIDLDKQIIADGQYSQLVKKF